MTQAAVLAEERALFYVANMKGYKRAGFPHDMENLEFEKSQEKVS